jgi:hypothetical protein
MKRFLPVIGGLLLLGSCAKNMPSQDDNYYPSPMPSGYGYSAEAVLLQAGFITCGINKTTYIFEQDTVCYYFSQGYFIVSGTVKAKGWSFGLLIPNGAFKNDSIQSNSAILQFSGNDFNYQSDSISVLLVGKPDSILNGAFSGRVYDSERNIRSDISNGIFAQVSKYPVE